MIQKNMTCLLTILLVLLTKRCLLNKNEESGVYLSPLYSKF